MSIQTQTSSYSGARAWRGRALALVAAAALGAPSMAGCTNKQLQGTSPSYLIVNSLSAASGADPSRFGSVLGSDVVTLVKVTGSDGKTVEVPTVFDDLGQMDLSLGLKDPGSQSTPNSPTSANFITVTRYHVQFTRADGRNTEGVDVPFSFDGAATATISGSSTTIGFTIVRAVAKTEAPLKALAGKSAANTISTIANVTFYGTDQSGRQVTVTASITVDFGDFADPGA
jgi:hypothetical protein